MFSLVFSLLLLFIFFGLMFTLWIVRLKKNWLGWKDEPEPKEMPVKKNQATVLEKKTEKVMTGTYRMPGHYFVYQLVFRMENGKTRCLTVPKEIFEQVFINETGELVTQGDSFLDFKGRFSTDLDSPS